MHMPNHKKEKQYSLVSIYIFNLKKTQILTYEQLLNGYLARTQLCSNFCKIYHVLNQLEYMNLHELIYTIHRNVEKTCKVLAVNST